MMYEIMRRVIRYLIVAAVIFAILCTVCIAQHWDVLSAGISAAFHSVVGAVIELVVIFLILVIIFKTILP